MSIDDLQEANFMLVVIPFFKISCNSHNNAMIYISIILPININQCHTFF